MHTTLQIWIHACFSASSSTSRHMWIHMCTTTHTHTHTQLSRHVQSNKVFHAEFKITNSWIYTSFWECFHLNFGCKAVLYILFGCIEINDMCSMVLHILFSCCFTGKLILYYHSCKCWCVICETKGKQFSLSISPCTLKATPLVHLRSLWGEKRLTAPRCREKPTHPHQHLLCSA